MAQAVVAPAMVNGGVSVRRVLLWGVIFRTEVFFV